MEAILLLHNMISNYAKLRNMLILLLLSHLIRFTYTFRLLSTTWEHHEMIILSNQTCCGEINPL